MTVECPMCFKEFNENEIEQHASNCLDSFSNSSFSEEEKKKVTSTGNNKDVKIEDEEFSYEEKEEKMIEIEEEKKEEKEEEIQEMKKNDNEVKSNNNKMEAIEDKVKEIEKDANKVEEKVLKEEKKEEKEEKEEMEEKEENEEEKEEEPVEEKKEEEEEKMEEKSMDDYIISDKKLIDDEIKKELFEEKMEIIIEPKDGKISSDSEYISEKKEESEEDKKDDVSMEEEDDKSEKRRKKEKKEKAKKEKRENDRKRRDSRASRKHSVTLVEGKQPRKKRVKTETLPTRLEHREKSDPSMIECNNCKDFIVPAQSHSLELCGHTYCIPCLRAGLRDVITGKTTREPLCVTCQSTFTNSDIISIYNPRKYQKYCQKTLELLAAIRLSPTTVCNKCSKPVKFGRRLFILPEITDDSHRERFMSSPSKDIERILYRAEHTCKMACKKCETDVCILCGKESGGEYAHPPLFCPIVYSVMISEILDTIDTLFYRFYGLQLTKKDTADANSGESKKSSSSSDSRAAKGVGFDGSVSDNYSGVAVAHQKENQQRAILCNLFTLLTSIISSSSYICHPSLFPLIQNSCLLPLLVSYFRTAWLMDVSAQQGELYFAVLSLLKAMSSHPTLIGIFTYPLAADSEVCLLDNLNTLSTQASIFTKQAKSFEAQENAKSFNVLGLALDIQSTASHVEEQLLSWKSSKLISYFSPIKPKEENVEGVPKAKSRTSRIFKRKSTIRKITKEEKIVILDDPKKREEFYVNHLRSLQFEFMSPYPKSLQNVRYTSEYQTVLNQSSLSPDVMIRLSQELSSLATSLPISPSSGIYMRVNEEKINLMRFIIIGPEDTPYANGCFEFEMVIGSFYPSKPPAVQLMTTGAGSVRFNPNLYDTGKVCLSLLGTWSGPGWDPKVSTLLQVLVSIQSLILVPDPYFNEPGYERDMGTELGKSRSKAYNSNIRYHNMRLAMVDQIKNPTPGFEEVIRSHFYLRKDEILKQTQVWVDDNPSQQMKDTYESLKKELAALSPPSGVKNK